jgi:hypothetical protein
MKEAIQFFDSPFKVTHLYVFSSLSPFRPFGKFKCFKCFLIATLYMFQKQHACINQKKVCSWCQVLQIITLNICCRWQFNIKIYSKNFFKKLFEVTLYILMQNFNTILNLATF